MSEPGPSSSIGNRDSAPKLEIEVVRLADGWAEAGLDDLPLEKAATAAFAADPPADDLCYELSIVLADDAEQLRLNRTWRGKASSTNVLSFPGGDETGPVRHLGDVVLAYETVRREADEQVISFDDHVCHLIVHGVLHLLGYDHLEEEEAERMERLEAKVLATIGIGDPYADTDRLQAVE